MKFPALLTVFLYGIFADAIFQRDVSLFEWRFWLPIGMMAVGFMDGLLYKNNE